MKCSASPSGPLVGGFEQSAVRAVIGRCARASFSRQLFAEFLWHPKKAQWSCHEIDSLDSSMHRKAVRILQQRCASAHAMENSHEPSSSATSVQNPLECNEEAQALLASMTESDRELISARMACETWQQAADRLGISVDLARQRWRNLRMRMQRSTV